MNFFLKLKHRGLFLMLALPFAAALGSLQEIEQADLMIFSSTFFLLFIFPPGVWLIQPGVNRLYHRIGEPARTDEA